MEILDSNQDDTLNYEQIFDDQIFMINLKQKLISILDQFPGKKILYLDKKMLDLVNFIVQANTLKDNGIIDTFYLDQDESYSEINQVIFFLSPSIEHVKRIAKIIHSDQSRGQQKKYCSIFSPRITSLCREAFEKLGVMSNIIIKNFNFDLIPLESDLFSLEINTVIEDMYFDKDQSIFQQVADSIQRIELLYGKSKKVFAKGHAAKGVLQVLLNREKSGRIFEDEGNDYSLLDSIIMIDRTSDLISPLCTPFTYQAIVDQKYQINQNFVEVPATLFKEKVQNNQETCQLYMNSNTDEIYKQIRGKNVKSCQGYLQKRRDECKNYIQSKKENILNISQQEREMFIKQSKIFTFILNHIVLVCDISQMIDSILFDKNMKAEVNIILQNNMEETLEHIDNLIAFQYPLEEILRLLALYSQVENGIKQKQYDHFRKEIVEVYGIQHLITLNKMQEIGLIKKQVQKSEWENLRTKLDLINEEVDLDNPDDISYVYLAYAPLSVRLVEQTFKQGQWKDIQKELEYLNGPSMFQAQEDTNQSKRKKLVLVYYVGGVTYGEVAALRLLAKKYNKEIIICTTNIINSQRLIKMLM
ncbi:vacuolar sorting protein, putative [Ichthyophthirius multifiliis]|uniref:Vacuolar sorting protein, putative n=1 Tax=Ichthyophthirius multifiliis TaxID=5932 RepID=G0QNG4_ICHMU|nr:vacuolar sorting protein, putative [Ichthyophthirius multifiliis]EGR33241.1 vacuolar sorting protein, putative [Ichthyophthirius multifiliis]|eukprot:XP_004037227.1 vacuolar sorting protein, putative [Ichthyophthirius multifiliis]